MHNLQVIEGSSLRVAPKVTHIKPLGSTVMVELLNQQELTSAVIKLSQIKKNQGAPSDYSNQAYVVALGPALKDNDMIKVGDRVFINGGFIELPETDEVTPGRVRGLVEYHAIKAVFSE